VDAELLEAATWLLTFSDADVHPVIRESAEWRKIAVLANALLNRAFGPIEIDTMQLLAPFLQWVYATGYARGKREATELDPAIWGS